MGRDRERDRDRGERDRDRGDRDRDRDRESRRRRDDTSEGSNKRDRSPSPGSDRSSRRRRVAGSSGWDLPPDPNHITAPPPPQTALTVGGAVSGAGGGALSMGMGLSSASSSRSQDSELMGALSTTGSTVASATNNNAFNANVGSLPTPSLPSLPIQLPSSALFQAAAAASAAASQMQNTKHLRMLYVGNLPMNQNERDVIDFFNAQFAATGIAKNQNPTPIIGMQYTAKNQFGFLEFTDPDDATTGIALDGIQYQGHSLKIRRPKSYQQAFPDQPHSAAPAVKLTGVISTVVEDTPNKIFMGNLPFYLTEEQVRELAQSFGPLKAFNLVKDMHTGNSKGFCFFEYSDPAVTDRAIAGLHATKLGDKEIVVQRSQVGHGKPGGVKPIQPQELSKHLVPEIIGPVIPMINNSALHFLNLSMPIASAFSMLRVVMSEQGTPTRVLVLGNMARIDDLTEPKIVDDIRQQVEEQCATFGTVVSIEIPTPPVNKPKEGDLLQETDLHKQIREKKIYWGVGKVFVEFEDVDSCKRAHDELAGKTFTGRVVATGYFDENRYKERRWEPIEDEEKAVKERLIEEQAKLPPGQPLIPELSQNTAPNANAPPLIGSTPAVGGGAAGANVPLPLLQLLQQQQQFQMLLQQQPQQVVQQIPTFNPATFGLNLSALLQGQAPPQQQQSSSSTFSQMAAMQDQFEQ